MDRTRLSLYYLATYLPLAGLALLFVPDFATKLLLSNRTYDDAFMRLAGALLVALGVLVIQIVRYRVEGPVCLDGVHPNRAVHRACAPVCAIERPVLPGDLRDRRDRGRADGVGVLPGVEEWGPAQGVTFGLEA